MKGLLIYKYDFRMLIEVTGMLSLTVIYCCHNEIQIAISLQTETTFECIGQTLMLLQSVQM